MRIRIPCRHERCECADVAGIDEGLRFLNGVYSVPLTMRRGGGEFDCDIGEERMLGEKRAGKRVKKGIVIHKQAGKV